jgi:arylformamidase
MRIYDVSVPVHDALPVWPGEDRVRLRQTARISEGNAANVSQISCGVHTGTHVDAPLHFVDGGAPVEQLDLHTLMGPVFVGDVRGVESIGPELLARLPMPSHTERLLLRTDNSALWTASEEFNEHFAALTPEAASWVVGAGVKLVGIDYLSIQRYHDPEPWTHRILLGAGVIILEGLNLGGVGQGMYELVCLPLLLAGAEGAPARAVLIER